MNDALLFSGLITFSVIVGFVALKFFPKNPLIKAIYYCTWLYFFGFRRDWYFSTHSSDNTFFVANTLFFCARFISLRTLVLETKLYQKYLKSFNETSCINKKSKKFLFLTFSTTMLLIGFYFTPSVVGRTIIAILIAVKYWFFFFWIKTEDVEKWIMLSLLGLKVRSFSVLFLD